MSAGAPNTDLLQIDDELTDEERLIRDTVRAFARDRVLPHVEDWFEEGTLPRPDLVRGGAGDARGAGHPDHQQGAHGRQDRAGPMRTTSSSSGRGRAATRGADVTPPGCASRDPQHTVRILRSSG